MPRQVINIPDAPQLPFSPAVRAGDFIYVSGQTGHRDENGHKVEGIENQTTRTIKEMQRVLEAAGATLDDVIKVTIFLKDDSYFAKMNEVYQSYFLSTYPARSTALTGLVHPDMLVEMECIAYLPQQK